MGKTFSKLQSFPVQGLVEEQLVALTVQAALVVQVALRAEEEEEDLCRPMVPEDLHPRVDGAQEEEEEPASPLLILERLTLPQLSLALVVTVEMPFGQTMLITHPGIQGIG